MGRRAVKTIETNGRDMDMFDMNRYKTLVAEILHQPHRDIRQYPRKHRKAKYVEQNYYRSLIMYDETLTDIEEFIAGDWCEALCKYVDIDREAYAAELRKRIGTQREKVKRAIKKVEDKRCPNDVSKTCPPCPLDVSK